MTTAERRGQEHPRALAWIERCSAGLAAGVLLQAVLAGQFLSSRPGMLDLHRFLAEAIPIAAIVLVALAWKRRRLGTVGQQILQLSVLSLVAIVIQTGLGFAGRSSPTAVAVHVPLGVALFGCLLWITFTAHSLRHAPKDEVQPEVG
jgi:hypothetical protein